MLPTLGSSVGRYFGGDEGAKLGGQAASAAGRAFGLELEGLSNEDREFEVARRYVDFAGEAVRKLAADGAAGNPTLAARAAAAAAALTHAPGLSQARAAPGRSSASASPHGSGATGRWVQHGSKIILYGV